ncbi:MAG TPA: prenyltransferase [Abditibacteriaceae bacterium]|nr:prenyltransferase [Abditibacteriaceae bacterium]
MSRSSSSSSIAVSKLFKLSRPRFWIYVLGPYLVGLASGAAVLDDFQRWPVLLFGLFFTFPANLLIYGVIDIFDYETDKNNVKKTDYESLVTPDERSALWRAIALATLPFLIVLPAVPTAALPPLAAFLFFSIFYSTPPIRAKAKPVLDSAFNVLYIFPGVFAYYLIGGRDLSIQLVVAAWCWAMAMHAYSAVPDISADYESGLKTVATLFGFHGTLLLCLLLYAAAAILSSAALGLLSVLLGTAYVALMLYSMTRRNEAELLRVYKLFPSINTISGAALFFSVFLSKFFQM